MRLLRRIVKAKAPKMTASLKILIATPKIKIPKKSPRNLLLQRLKMRHVKCGNCLIQSLAITRHNARGQLHEIGPDSATKIESGKKPKNP